MEAQTLYEKVFLQIDHIFQPDAFLLALYDSIDESITIAYAVEEGRPIIEFLNQRFDKKDSGLMGWIMNNKKTLRYADMTIEKLPVDSPQEGKPIRSWMGVPLINKGEVIGAISVQCFNADVYSESHQRLLESMAAQLAVALDNVRLIEQAKSQVERLAALHDIDTAINSSLDLRVIMNILLDQVIQRLQVDAAVVLLLDQYSRQLEFTAGRGFNTHDIEKYSIGVGENSSGQKALEQHLVQALDEGTTGEKPGYAEIMQKEGFESFYSVPLIAKGQLKGVLDVFHRAPLNPAQDWFNFLETLAGQAAIAIDNTTLLEDLNNTNIDLTQAYDTTLEGWSRALDMRDHETEGHTRRVAEITVKIARELGIPEHELIHIRRGALLHDIGKMGIPDKILLKPGPLDEQEWEIMRSHARRAYDLLYPIEYLRLALEIPLHHHEKFDGTGYPDGLKGNEIPLPARIFAVVDVWDALTSDRPYRKAWTTKKSLDYIKKQSGGHFDPEAVKVFLDLIQDELIDNKDIY
jgi:putative nucleotidyltransferase with HDIG domain